jgi:beta-RFAP synthase
MKVQVSAPSRLHLGDFDPFGVGRFGYAPIVAIDKPRTIVQTSKLNVLQINSDDVEVKRFAEKTLEGFNLDGVKVSVISTPPRHSGFGSTTQLSLSIGKAITSLYDLNVKCQEIIKIAGKTTVGGLYIFQHGGFVLAGGLKVKPSDDRFFEKEEPMIPPLILRLKFPKDWRFVVIVPKTSYSLHGDSEDRAFKELRETRPPLKLIHKAYFILASKLIPSILDEDSRGFGDALTQIQFLAGSIYKPIQGSAFNPLSQWIVPIIKRSGALGLGQSSWGPTVYGFTDDEDRAKSLAKKIRNQVKNHADVFITKSDNTGARTKHLD